MCHGMILKVDSTWKQVLLVESVTAVCPQYTITSFIQHILIQIRIQLFFFFLFALYFSDEIITEITENGLFQNCTK